MSVFSKDNIVELLNDEFVNVAINCGTHQQRQDQPGKFFQKIAEQGHYAGRTEPTGTRQGIYIATPEGTLIRSDNTTNAAQVTGLIYPALRHWKVSYADENRDEVNAQVELDQKMHPKFPVGGIALLQTMRDLPRPDQTSIEAWRHNFDHVWMSRSEAMSFIPSKKEVGAERPVDPKFTRRFLQYHLVDQVRGSSSPWVDEDFQTSELVSKVVELTDDIIHLEVAGIAKINQEPSGKLNPFLNKRITRDRGVELKIRGKLVYDRAAKTFKRFDLIAFGDRWGADVYNGRHGDLEPAPIGFAFELVDAEIDPAPPTFMLWNKYFADD